jgi:hypothetical protein
MLCAGCGRLTFKGAPLVGHVEDAPGGLFCEDCWHTARQATPAYQVRSEARPSAVSHCAWVPCVYTLLEATARAAKMNARREFGCADFAPVHIVRWEGERMGHGIVALLEGEVEH